MPYLKLINEISDKAKTNPKILKEVIMNHDVGRHSGQIEYVTIPLYVTDLEFIRYFQDEANLIFKVTTPSKHLKAHNRIRPDHLRSDPEF